MALKVYICEAFTEEVYLKSGFLEVFASVADAVFCGYSADIYVGGVKKFKDFSEGLLGIVKCLKARVLLRSFVAAFIKGEFFAGIW